MKVGKIQVQEADDLITGEQELTIGGFTFQILETPGHSPGSVSLYFADDGIVVAGDVLFKGALGVPIYQEETRTAAAKYSREVNCLTGRIPLYFAVTVL